MYFRFIMTSYIVLTVVVLDNDGLVDNNDNDVDNDGIPDFRDNDPRADKLEHEIPRGTSDLLKNKHPNYFVKL